MRSALRTARGRSARRSAAGYTMVEVMMALALLGLGATGIAGMQKTVILGDTNARNLATANAIASAWADRLQADAVGWTATLGKTSTQWLKNAAAPGSAAWFNPAVTGYVAGASDIVGGDILVASAGTTPQGFCTQVRLSNLSTSPTGVIRAEIRVVYQRQSAPVTCAQLATAAGIAAIDNGTYGAVYLTTGILPSSL